MGEGDLQRLGQPGDTHATETQAHQAIVQHSAVILQAEPGTLWREMGEVRLHKGLSQLNPGGAPGSLQDLRPQGQRAKDSWVTFLLLLP